MNDSTILGEYDLRGVMEVGSGFIFEPDHTFKFFFSYGAVDREGIGSWAQKGNQLILNSEPWPRSDFKMEQHQHSKKKNITIQIRDANKYIVEHVGCRIVGGGKDQTGETDENGVIVFSLQSIDTIQLAHEFFSDQFSNFIINDPDENDFVFTFLPTLGRVYFKDFILNITEDGLEGPHPIMKDRESYSYDKSE